MSSLPECLKQRSFPSTFKVTIMWRALALVVFSLMCHPSQAYFESGNALVTTMREHENAERKNPNTDYQIAAEYRSYVTGVFDVLYISEIICPHGETTVRQVTAIVSKFFCTRIQRAVERGSSNACD